jgi:DNA topoisomerase-1
MSKTLVIVESPAKAKTISRFLGKDYTVLASYGHVRDLPEKSDQIPEEFKKKKWARLGVNIEADYEPIYVISSGKSKQVAELRKAAKAAERILLATDEDREGESISWHVLQVLKPKKSTKVERIVFHEITPEAIEAALNKPRSLDEDLVKAQETRRILDRLYGYSLSPVLWKKVAPKLSAGRVQSVAVRLIVLRERERKAFTIVSYSGIEAVLQAEAGSFTAKLQRIDDSKLATGQSFDSTGSLSEKNSFWLKKDEANSAASNLKSASPWKVISVETKPGVENPPPPFMTSTLQQDANRKFGWPARRTMQIAQELYEGIDLAGERTGLITYMRTDSLALADRAVNEARGFIKSEYGAEYVPEKPNRYRSRAKNAQEAHEAIRPTDVNRTPQQLASHLSAEQKRLYELIWKRTMACQMAKAKVERTKAQVSVEESGRELIFGASGKRIAFPGFLRVYEVGTDEAKEEEARLPKLSEGETVSPEAIEATEHTTRPPARYTEATLIRTLESEGIGRPSTYASIIGTIQDRGYVFKKKNELIPTFTAFAVTELLEGAFSDLVDIGFTAQMETELDEIAEGDRDPVAHLRGFYEGGDSGLGIDQQIKDKTADIEYPAIAVAEKVVVKIGRQGPYLQQEKGEDLQRASLPEDIAPADLDEQTIADLLKASAEGPKAVGEVGGKKIFAKKGRYGAYLEVESDGEEKPKRVTFPPDLKQDEITQADLDTLMSYPRIIGTHPETSNEIKLALGRYGAYITCGDLNANVGDWREGAGLTLDQALEHLAKSKRKASREAIKSFGTLPEIEGEVKLMEGPYGPYVTNGSVNATVPKGTDPESLTVEQAAQLVKDKIAAGPSKKRSFKRKKKS